MLKLQDHLNSMINPAWVTSGSRFLRAAFVESAEALEHHGWKWWKKQTIDLPQVQMELVDILHFYLSHTIVQAGGSIEGAGRADARPGRVLAPSRWTAPRASWPRWTCPSCWN
ncbi:dUTPase [Achromobacter xylosoxidans]